MKKRINAFLFRYVVITLIALGLRCLAAFGDPVPVGSMISMAITALIIVCLQEVFGNHDDKDN